MKRRDVRAYLHDILEAAQLMEEFSAGQSLDDYVRDAKLRSAVERQFEIIGEALNQALRLQLQLGASITGSHRIIALPTSVRGRRHAPPRHRPPRT